MNRIVKTFAFLTVLTASFAYAQDEVDEVKGKDAKTIGVDAEQKANTVTPKIKPTKPEVKRWKVMRLVKLQLIKLKLLKLKKVVF